MADENLISGSVPENYDKYPGPLFFETYAIELLTGLKIQSIKMCSSLLEAQEG